MVSRDSTRRSPPQSLRELEVRAAALEGRSVGELTAALGLILPAEPHRAKGFVGAIVELALGADPRAHDRPDFPDLGVELKTIPVGLSNQPTESTFCCAITMATADQEDWDSSRLKCRLERVLWVPVQAAGVAPLPDRVFGGPRLWTPSREQMRLLQDDWEDLIGAIGAGRSPSAHEGRVLQVRPKAAHSRARALAPDDDGPGMKLPLGFYLRRSFTGAILCAAGMAINDRAARPHT